MIGSYRKLPKAWLYGLLLCLCFRAIIPTGFMPGAGGASGFASWISLCYGNAGSAQLLHLVEQHHHAEAQTHAHGHAQATNGHDRGTESSHPTTTGADHTYCLFASIGLDDITPNHQPVDVPFEQRKFASRVTAFINSTSDSAAHPRAPPSIV